MTDDDLVRRLLVGACAQNDVAWSLMRAAADRIKALTAEHNATLARLAGAVAREIALTAERDRLRGGIEYVLDGYGLNGPDYRFQDGEDGDWISDRLVAALKGETP